MANMEPLTAEEIQELSQKIPGFASIPHYQYLAERRLLPQQRGIESFENPSLLTNLRRKFYGLTKQEKQISKQQEEALVPFEQEQQILTKLQAAQKFAEQMAPSIGQMQQQFPGIPVDPSQIKTTFMPPVDLPGFNPETRTGFAQPPVSVPAHVGIGPPQIVPMAGESEFAFRYPPPQSAMTGLDPMARPTMAQAGMYQQLLGGHLIDPNAGLVPPGLQGKREEIAMQATLAQSPMGKLLADLGRTKAGTEQSKKLLDMIEAQLDPEALQTFKGALDLAGIQRGTPEYKTAMTNYVAKLSTHPTPVDIKVNTMLSASEEAQKDFIKSTRATYDQLKQAPAALTNIEKAKKLIPAARGFMGPGGETLLEVAKFMNNRLGMTIDTAGIKSAEELRSRIFFNIMDSLKKMDAQPSQMQQMIMMESLGKLGTDPNALSFVLDAFADAIRTKVETHNLEVESAIKTGVKFPYDPRIKIPGALPTVQSDEDYKKLPPGTEYLAPDGSRRRKQ